MNHNTVARAYLEPERLRVTEPVNGVGGFLTLRGPEIAAGERRAKTPMILRRPLTEALRAGHTFEDVQPVLKEPAWMKRTA